MSTEDMPLTKLTTIASFPDHYFLESMAIRRDSSILVTVMNHQEAGLPQIKERKSVCTGLTGGGRWIRTLGPPATASFVVGPPTARLLRRAGGGEVGATIDAFQGGIPVYLSGALLPDSS
jgi:hypothetical protein